MESELNNNHFIESINLLRNTVTNTILMQSPPWGYFLACDAELDGDMFNEVYHI